MCDSGGWVLVSGIDGVLQAVGWTTGGVGAKQLWAEATNGAWVVPDDGSERYKVECDAALQEDVIKSSNDRCACSPCLGCGALLGERVDAPTVHGIVLDIMVCKRCKNALLGKGIAAAQTQQLALHRHAKLHPAG
jgi:hypothetical protein